MLTSRRIALLVRSLALGVLCTAAAACTDRTVGDPASTYPTEVPGTNRNDPVPNPGSQEDRIFGSEGFTLFGGGGGSEGGGGIGVNSFLWRASLDTLSFMPLSSVDPFGGVIITDWYASPEAPRERFKMTVYILDKRLRADGVKVAVFRQVQNGQAAWSDAPSDPQTAVKLENAILTRARQLRIDTVQ